ncbi:hypothetical protein HNQ94_002880 [Salirhabdus euzebyi]|uniref:Uncharacterized protein n=1 Tax=Salirhabdus euzebyi TaxID=394506 RepID=A0A841Q7M7_9BACI|nr:hypothetical protein [Salirhabdus euzebyi]MBB6454398.1 hypothetical protein [Salirhabdus euzebyi]
MGDDVIRLLSMLQGSGSDSSVRGGTLAKGRLKTDGLCRTMIWE